jgi:predicted CXXCH cytochrome family protein
MRTGHRLIVACAALLTTAIVVRAQTGASSASPAPPFDSGRHLQGQAAPLAQGKPGSGSSDYLGSGACAACHEAEHGEWIRSLHIQMTKPIEEAVVAGNFAPGTRFSDHGRSYEFGRKDGRPFVSVSFAGRPPETFPVHYTLGAKRYQGYLSTLPDGRMFVLPVFWHVESRRWLDWKEITPIPDGAHDIRQIWNVNCFNCHGTNIVQGFDAASKRYQTTWTEMGIGCEACHGPGREHAALMEAWEKDPSSKPSYDNSSKNRALSDTIKVLSTRSAEPRRVFDTCAYCHGNKNNVFVGFRGGDRYEDYALPFIVSGALPPDDFQGEFWPDGRPNRFNRPQALMLSGCFQAGAIACTNCHVAHGSGNEHSLKVNIYEGRNGDALCTQCHAKPRAGQAVVEGVSQHSYHAPDSPGSRCINCHMSDVNWRLLIRRRDHTFRPPVPETTAQYGVPNACTTCHDDKPPEWAARQMDGWWGDGNRRTAAARVADVMYRAGSGDATVIADLARLAVDRSQGAPIRASAADYLGQFALGRVGTGGSASPMSQTSYDPGGSREPGAGNRGSGSGNRGGPVRLPPAVVNALIGAAADPEAIVRAAALDSLAATGERDRILPPVTARLTDPARVVRARAAEILLVFGVSALPGGAGAALARAQDDLADSARAFPSVASGQATLGWLEAARGRTAEAERALDDAISLQPNYARPYVLKGVIAARANRFSDALGLWKKARSLEPSYPNIDALIAEGEKRLKQ